MRTKKSDDPLNLSGALRQSVTLPPPRPGRGGAGKAVFWAIIFVAILGATAFWLTREPQNRAELRAKAAEIINGALKETPLAGIGDILRDSPHPPPHVLNPPTAAGTLSGRSVLGTIGSPIDSGARVPLEAITTAIQPAMPAAPEEIPAPEDSEDHSEADIAVENEIAAAPQEAAAVPETSALPQDAPQNAQMATAAPFAPLPGSEQSMRATEPGQVVFSPDILPPATEDSRLPPEYLAEVARWLVSRYRPGANGGSLATSVKGTSHFLGTTIAGRASGGRAALMRYALQPSMLQGLYNLYLNRFLEDLNTAAKQRGLTDAQNRDFHRLVAGRAASAGAALAGALAVPNLPRSLARIDELAQNSVELNAQLASAVFALDGLREASASPTQIETARMRVDGLTARYRRSLEEHERAQKALIAAIRKNARQTLDDDSLLYIAAWVDRRLASGEGADEAIKTCSLLLRDFARVCAEAE